jgi:uncharacterized membrane protein
MQDKRAELLKDEYLQLQKTIEDFDARTLTIKAWSVSFSLIALAGAFVSHAAVVLLVASVSSCLFWFIEGFWKRFQLAYYSRTGKIESYFAGEVEDIVPMQIGWSWYHAYTSEDKRPLLLFKSKDKIRLLRSKSKDRIHFPIMFWPWVALPHAYVFLLGLLLYMLHWMNVIHV